MLDVASYLLYTYQSGIYPLIELSNSQTQEHGHILYKQGIKRNIPLVLA